MNDIIHDCTKIPMDIIITIICQYALTPVIKSKTSNNIIISPTCSDFDKKEKLEMYYQDTKDFKPDEITTIYMKDYKNEKHYPNLTTLKYTTDKNITLKYNTIQRNKYYPKYIIPVRHIILTISDQLKVVIDLQDINDTRIKDHLMFSIVGKSTSSKSVNKLPKSTHYIYFNIFTYEILKYEFDKLINETELLYIYNQFIIVFKRCIHLCQCVNIYI